MGATAQKISDIESLFRERFFFVTPDNGERVRVKIFAIVLRPHDGKLVAELMDSRGVVLSHLYPLTELTGAIHNG
jgi:hypothetical protein